MCPNALPPGSAVPRFSCCCTLPVAPYRTGSLALEEPRPARLGRTRQSEFSFGEAGEDERLRFFQRRDRIRAADAGELLKKLAEGVSRLQIVEKRLKGNACAAENGLSA